MVFSITDKYEMLIIILFYCFLHRLPTNEFWSSYLYDFVNFLSCENFSLLGFDSRFLLFLKSLHFCSFRKFLTLKCTFFSCFFLLNYSILTYLKTFKKLCFLSCEDIQKIQRIQKKRRSLNARSSLKLSPAAIQLPSSLFRITAAKCIAFTSFYHFCINGCSFCCNFWRSIKKITY